jgi:hypothetical protein
MIQITLRQKIYIAAAIAGILLLTAAVRSIRTGIQINRLEREAAANIKKAAMSERTAAAAEENAARQSARAELLEQQIQEIRAIATKQDEELKKLAADTDTARGRVEHARRVRSIESNADELCRKLESLGHGCEE